MAPNVISAVSALIVAAASVCSLGEAKPLPSAWTHLPKPPSKLGHDSKCGWLEACEKCVKKNGVWKKEWAHEGTYCDDGYYCNGREQCNARGKCMPGTPPDCSKTHFGDIHPHCGKAVCSERHKSCKVAIKPGNCRDGDKCTTNDQCDIVTGQCVGIPKWCGSDCHTCHNGKCGKGCDADEQCKWGKCHEKPAKQCSGKKACDRHGCKWEGCGDCEECKWGQCKPIECAPCYSCDGKGGCKYDCASGHSCVHDHVVGEHACKPDEPEPEHECKKNKDCMSDCQVCHNGECVDKLDKKSCQCPDDLKADAAMCNGCEHCHVTEITGGMVTACKPDAKHCPVTPERVCEGGTIADVTCYKCGDDPLYCLVLGTDDTNLGAIENEILATCDGKKAGKGKTCAQQTCAHDIKVVLAPILETQLTEEDQRRLAASGGATPPDRQCLPAPGENFQCPCSKDDGSPQYVDNIGKYKVCITELPDANPASSRAVAPLEPVVEVIESKCERVCKKNKHGKLHCETSSLCPDDNMIARDGSVAPVCVDDGMELCLLEDADCHDSASD